MRVKSRKAGRGGVTHKLHGYCPTCRQHEQSNAVQQYLSGYQQEQTPVTEPEPASGDDFDPAELMPVELDETGPETQQKPRKAQPAKTSSGGAGRWIMGGFCILAVALGAGALVKN